MTFKAAVRATSELAGCYEQGLMAVKGAYRQKMVAETSQCSWRGSVDIDAGLASRYPNEARWDYAIGFGYAHRSDGVAYVEVHPAATTHVDEVIKKKNWLVSWLAGCAPVLGGIAVGGFYWVSSDGVHIQRGSPQSRRLAQSGITVGKIARIG